MSPLVTVFDASPDDVSSFPQGLGSAFEVTVETTALDAATAVHAVDAEIVSVSARSMLTADLLAAHLPRLRLIACRSTGYDNVDLAAAQARQISVCTVPGYGDATVAEYAALLMLAVSRRLRQAMHAVDTGEVRTEQLTGRDLQGQTLGLLGAGRIGRHLAGIARGLGMTVIALDPRPDPASALAAGFTYVELDELLTRSDVISLHAPALPQTHHVLDRKAFAAMKRGVVIVNTSRGSLIDTPALIEALERGIVAGAGLDVLEGERFLEASNQRLLLEADVMDERSRQVLALAVLTRMPNVVITDHNAFNTAEALERIRQGTISNIRAWHAGRPTHLTGPA